MKISEQPPQVCRRLIALTAAALVILVLTAIGSYGLLTGPRNDPSPSPGPAEAPTPSPSSSTNPAEIELPGLPPSTDPQEFARTVATGLFTWDTGTGLMPLDYTAPILEYADPTGTEQAGLASDIAAYLPTREAWTDLRQYATAQTISIDNAYVPEEWGQALDQAQPGQLPAGAIAVTIEGTRHRAGVWNDEPVTSEHPVAFTIFLTCPDTDTPGPSDKPAAGPDATAGPVEPTCSVMRLSMLDKPLR